MLELLQKYPEAARVVKSYYLDLMLSSINNEDLPEDFKEHVRAQGIDDDKIAVIIGSSPRSLFDVFDDNGLCIQITGDNTVGWFWEVDGTIDNAVCNSRKEAEKLAVEESFRILNEQICQTES